MERQLSRNTVALLNALKQVNVGDYIIRANAALAEGKLDEAAAAVAALANANRGIYDARRQEAFKTAKNYFRYGRTVEEATKRVIYSNAVWDYLKPFFDVASN